MNGRLTRLTMNPGVSALRIGVLPQARTTSSARATTSGAVSGPGIDLDERHPRDRVEEVEPQDPGWVRRHRGDGLDREGAGVRGEDRFLGRTGIEGPEDLVLQPEVLQRGLQDQIGFVGEVREGMGIAQALDPARHPFIDRVGIEIELGGSPFESVADAVSGPVDRRGIDVVDDDLGARLEGGLGDAGAHDARAHDADRGAGGVGGWGRRSGHARSICVRGDRVTGLGAVSGEGLAGSRRPERWPGSPSR